jgi:hypothetical protein
MLPERFPDAGIDWAYARRPGQLRRRLPGSLNGGIFVVTNSSSRTTGNEPVEAIDPGGTKSARPAHGKKPVGGKTEGKLEQKVESGDRNGKS